MTKNNLPDWLEDEICGNYYPWHHLTEIGGRQLADLRFPLEAEADLESLAQEAQTLGFQVSTGRLHLFSGNTPDLFHLVIFVGTVVASGYTFLKIVNDGPVQVKIFLNKLLSLRRSKDLHPALYLDPVNEWLNAKYGPKNWRYDPDAIQVKQRTPGGPTVLALTEEVRNQFLLLLVGGEFVEELPSEWGPATEKNRT